MQVTVQICTIQDDCINAPINVSPHPPPRGGGGRQELDNFEKLVSNFLPMCHNFVSKIPCACLQI